MSQNHETVSMDGSAEDSIATTANEAKTQPQIKQNSNLEKKALINPMMDLRASQTANSKRGSPSQVARAVYSFRLAGSTALRVFQDCYPTYQLRQYSSSEVPWSLVFKVCSLHFICVDLDPDAAKVFFLLTCGPVLSPILDKWSAMAAHR